MSAGTYDSTETPKNARRRNKRGEATRLAVIDATIRTLNSIGFAATSIEQVMAECGIGRGSVLNQFPTRTDLMAATGEVAMARMVAAAQDKLAAMPDPITRARALFDISLESHEMPEAIAVTEIILASRWDRALAEALAPAVERIELSIDRLHLRLAKEAGVADTQAFLVHARLLNSNLRGITIELMVNANRQMILQARDALRDEHLAFIDHILTG
jgi:AcrR family transcriptional regulator